MSSFTIKPEDILPPKPAETVKAVQEVKKVAEQGFTNDLKSYVDTVKVFKSSIKETLDFMGLDMSDMKKAIKNKLGGILGNPEPQHQVKQIQQIQQPEFRTVEKPAVIKETKKIENKMEFDFDKILKKVKIAAKFLGAEEMTVKDFIAKVEAEKEDIKELLE